MTTTAVTKTTVPAARAAAGKMRCRNCCRYATVAGPDFIVQRSGSFFQTTHDGTCPEASGWGGRR